MSVKVAPGPPGPSPCAGGFELWQAVLYAGPAPTACQAAALYEAGRVRLVRVPQAWRALGAQGGGAARWQAFPYKGEGC